MADGSDFTTIRYEVSDRIATITLNRPQALNALDAVMERELIYVWDCVDEDDDVRAVVVTGSGRAFCAGYDLSGGDGFDVVARAAARGTEPLAPSGIPRDSGGLIALRMFRSLKPIVAAINGDGVGFGATFPLPMDVRLASETARWGFVFSRRGMCMDAAASWFLSRTVGISRALEWSCSGRLFGAEEALAGGLVRSLHPPDELLDAAYGVARGMTESTAPVSVALNRQLIWQMAGAAHPMDAHRMESIYIAQRASSADAVEGARSFLEKRPPDFPMTVGRDLPSEVPWQQEPPFERRAGVLMFNPLSASEMVTAIGRAAGTAARVDDPLDEFDRAQLLSAYSASRHLAIEIASFGTELRLQSEAIATAAERTARQLGGGDDAAALRRLAQRLRGADDAPSVGAAVADLLGLGRRREQAPWVGLRGEVRTRLRLLCDREVDLLAEGMEAGRG